ncbi:hypothetical protein FB45DRAFT_887155 [Roridomyces roridus]|uniref:Uncharacterized protein n=1 Tax=Roridomyces roridus TaxID=1738132 RepID=A0AAD7FYM8_9AGAR|nr:hypothetical protein FB45DRAFT_887155 [Roridomyces roridus]
MNQAISNYLKPHRHEAIMRVRSNALAVLFIAVLSTLVPRIPALPTALAVVLASKRSRPWSAEWMYASFCMLEVGAIVLLCLNILQSAYAVKYPRAPLPPTPMKTKSIHMASPTPQRSLRLSPNSSPQPQKSFSFGASGSMLQSSTSSTYPTSPLSTPSRVLHYPGIPPSTSTNTFVSSTSSINTPSPILSTYLGKRGGDYSARAFDGSLLTEIQRNPEWDDEE